MSCSSEGESGVAASPEQPARKWTSVRETIAAFPRQKGCVGTDENAQLSARRITTSSSRGQPAGTDVDVASVYMLVPPLPGMSILTRTSEENKAALSWVGTRPVNATPPE